MSKTQCCLPAFFLCFISIGLEAANAPYRLPRFFAYSDSSGLSKNISLIREENVVIDDSKFKASQCSVWLNNANLTHTSMEVGLVSSSQIFWARQRLNESFPSAPTTTASDSLPALIKRAFQSGHLSCTTWSIRLEPGVNHIAIDYGLNPSYTPQPAKKDTLHWMILPPIPSTVIRPASEFEINFRISNQKPLSILSCSPLAGWQQADTLLHCLLKGNFDSAEVSYTHPRFETLNATAISWETAFQQLDQSDKILFQSVRWKPVAIIGNEPSSGRKTMLWPAIVPAIILFLFVFYFIRKTKKPAD